MTHNRGDPSVVLCSREFISFPVSVVSFKSVGFQQSFLHRQETVRLLVLHAPKKWDIWLVFPDRSQEIISAHVPHLSWLLGDMGFLKHQHPRRAKDKVQARGDPALRLPAIFSPRKSFLHRSGNFSQVGFTLCLSMLQFL